MIAAFLQVIMGKTCHMNKGCEAECMNFNLTPCCVKWGNECLCIYVTQFTTDKFYAVVDPGVEGWSTI